MNNNEFISNALKYIAASYAEDLTLEQVAENAGFSVSYFNRIFAQSTGRTVMEYVREYRLIKAAEALRTGEQSIIEISLEAGYSNPENFARAFKVRYGASPSEYRENRKGSSLNWKDITVPTSINRFQTQFPQYQKADKDEFIDWLYLSNPVKHAFTICFASQIESAAFKLSENEYAYIEEYRADEMALTLYCDSKNIGKYADIFGVFQNCTVTAVCEPDDDICADNACLRYDYAYLKESVDFGFPQGYSFRELSLSDKKEIEKFSKANKNQVWHVFEQNKSYGNFAGTLFFGLWKNEKLVACAMPGVESDRGLNICDIGGIFWNEKYFTEELYINFWKAVVDYCLKNNLLPVNGGVTADDKKLGCGISESVGYTCVAKKYVFKR